MAGLWQSLNVLICRPCLQELHPTGRMGRPTSQSRISKAQNTQRSDTGGDFNYYIYIIKCDEHDVPFAQLT